MSNSGYVRDESSGKAAVAANQDEHSKYRAEKMARRKLKSLEERLASVEHAIESINTTLVEILKVMKSNG